MAFSMYQSLRTVPRTCVEASISFRLSAWQKFWRLEVPFATPGLVWNTMMSMSGGWFFVVASEAISVGDEHLETAGHRLLHRAGAIGARHWRDRVGDRRDAGRDPGVRPIAVPPACRLVGEVSFRNHRRSDRVRPLDAATDPAHPPAEFPRRFHRSGGFFIGRACVCRSDAASAASARNAITREQRRLWAILVCGLIGWGSWRAFTFAAAELTWPDLGEAVLLGLVTLLRVVVLMILASLIWVPIGVWLGLRPAWARRAQPLAQFLAAFPANLFFPVFVIVIVHFQLNQDIWLTPLMVLGTQWYILFNVVAGAAAFPGDLREVASNFRVGGFLWWRKVIIPGIFSYYITGAITASGGCWNAAIVAEVVSWGDTKLVAHGLGAYIAEATERGDMARVVLGVAVMSAFVLTFNRLLWHPLYAYARRRLTLG